MTATIERGRWYPVPPPALDGESDYAYTDRITGADRTGRKPYDHTRYRECSMGYHTTCSDPAGGSCGCPCHKDRPAPPGGVITPAAMVLAGLYYLPEASAQHVMDIALVALAAAPRNKAEVVRQALTGVYQSEITDWFVTDVVNVLRDHTRAG